MVSGNGNGPGNGEGTRDELGRFVNGGPCGVKPGDPGRNQRGGSDTQRFRAAVRRRLKLRMRTGDEDEFDQLADEVIDAAKAKEAGAVSMLKEIWAREDGPHQTRLAGANGEQIVPLVLYGIDAEAMRAGRKPEDALSAELPEE